MGNQLTMADLALVQEAVDEANASLGRALAVIENAAARLEQGPGCPGNCRGEDFGDCPGCAVPAAVSAGNYVWNDPVREPAGRVIGAGESRAQD